MMYGYPSRRLAESVHCCEHMMQGNAQPKARDSRTPNNLQVFVRIPVYGYLTDKKEKREKRK